MRCVDHSTVSTWRAVCDVLDAIEGKGSISNLSNFQTSHAAEIARAIRKREPNPAKWDEAIDGKHDLSHVSSFQPTHAREIARVGGRWRPPSERVTLAAQPLPRLRRSAMPLLLVPCLLFVALAFLPRPAAPPSPQELEAARLLQEDNRQRLQWQIQMAKDDLNAKRALLRKLEDVPEWNTNDLKVRMIDAARGRVDHLASVIAAMEKELAGLEKKH
jgi:hypothetical protein